MLDAAAAPPPRPSPVEGEASKPQGLSNATVMLMAVGAGAGAANLYYNQPMLDVLGGYFQVPVGRVGWVPAATQVGYALGILFLIPLGDRLERKRLILVKIGCLILSLLAAALAPGIPALAAASLSIGVFSTIAQDFVPFAAQLAGERGRASAIGRVMSGLFLGILVARTVSGAVSALFGWRAVFIVAAGFMAALGYALHRDLPRGAPTTTMSYVRLIGSLTGLIGRFATLRRASIVQGLLFASFSVFWTTLAPYLATPTFDLGSAAAGLFGLVGAAGAGAAALTGRVADRLGPRRLVGLGAGLAVVGFGCFALAPASLGGLVVGVIILDFGISMAIVANQAMVYALAPESRSRLNTVFVTGIFTGGAIGSLCATQAWVLGGWTAVTALGLMFTGAAFLANSFLGGIDRG